jgi:ATP-binding cassette subfamily C protein LapB
MSKRTDPVLACLARASAILDQPVHLEALRSELAPESDEKISLDRYAELAERHGMQAAWTQTNISALPNYALPVIAPFIDGRAALVLHLQGDSAKIFIADSGESDRTISISELQTLSTGVVMVVKADTKRSEQQLTPFRGAAFDWFWSTLLRFKGFYIESMVASVAANILTLAVVFFTMNVYDRVVPTQAYTSLWTLAIGTFIAIVIEFVMRWTKARLVDLAGKKADLAINATLLREIMTVQLEHRPQSIGIFSSAMRDFEALRDFFSSTSLVVITDLPFALLFLFLIWIIGGPIVIVPIIAAIVLLVFSVLAQKPLMKTMRENMKQSGDRQSVLVESMLNLEMLKAHNAQSYLQRRWERANEAAAETYKKTRALTNLMTGFTTAAQQLVTLGMVVVGVYLIHSSSLTLGGLIAAVILAGRAITPLGSIMSLAARFQQASVALETLDGLMKRPRDRDYDRKYLAPEKFLGKIDVDSLQFAYPEETPVPVIRGVSLNLKAGDHLGLLGKIGSGKTTLLRILAGLYRSESGQIRYDELDQHQIDPIVLRSRIGYVSQDSQLFMGSLRDNLILADSWISDEQIMSVLQRLQLIHLVSSHPRGLDMQLTEGGSGLSGGQRQLIALARMMLRDANFVFMDEPTSHMDQGTESLVIQVLGQWLIGRTLVLSTHRPQLLAWCNRIMVLDQGRVVGEGPKAEMLSKLSNGITVASPREKHQS